MSSLLIVESPAKCSKIQGFLGPGWKVIATMGHIRALDDTLDAVGLDRDFEPRYDFIKDKSKAIQHIRDCAKGLDPARIFLASDDDREGEAISYSVAVLLKLDVTVAPRIVFHEITKDAITTALRNPKRINMDRVSAQQARAVLDMMVGFTISPLLWKFVGASLSAGRCQTPALRLVADREAEIKDFQSETTWSIKGTWKAPNGANFDAVLMDSLEDEESAMNYLENVNDSSEGTIKSAKTKPTSEAPPKPLITSTLQQEASALYGSQPTITMRVAQKLYEAGHITYMRTDSAVLSEEIQLEAKAYIKETYGEEYIVAAETKPTKDTKKKVANAQEAHEAIRPTHIATVELPADEDWSAPERKLYKLIWNRTLQSLMPACKGEDRVILILCSSDPAEMEWKAMWHRIVFQGWRRVGQAIADLDEEDGDQVSPQGSWTLGQSLKEGSVVHWATMEAFPKETRATPRYTEATLVRDLEKRGIGRPSTFANLIGTILTKTYVEKVDKPARDVQVPRLLVQGPTCWPPERKMMAQKVGAEKQKLAPTPLGKSVIDFCIKEFGDLFEYGFTKLMEERLDKIAEGKEAWKNLCRDTWGSFRENYEKLKGAVGTQVQTARQKVFEKSGIKAVQSKKGPLLLIEGPGKDDVVFYGWPDDVAFSDITEEQAEAYVAKVKKDRISESIGEYESVPMFKKSGKFGTYISCGGANVPWVANDTLDTIREKLRLKRESVLHTIGPFEFRNGPHGVYMFKKDVTGDARKFVSVPSAVNPKILTAAAATQIYQTGLQEKAKARAYGKKRDT